VTSLRQLRYFLAVAEEGQITRAASKLHIAQPALSQAISQLELQLGVTLFVRHARGTTLTTAGEAFLEKARAALAAMDEADLTAQSFARANNRTLEVGFIGPPPSAKAPQLFAAFRDEHPDVELSFREIPFPRGPTASWLHDVDVAFCHLPGADPGVSVQLLRPEPRTVVAPRKHPLAERAELGVGDVLDEKFISYHPDVQPDWAGFHSLNDHRGAAPASTTGDRPLTPAEMLSVMTAQRGITTIPACDATIVANILSGVVAIPLRDAEPARLGLVWRKDSPSPHVAALAAVARRASTPGD
jgi:DNA-binding transcriptional LysR family regulator